MDITQRRETLALTLEAIAANARAATYAADFENTIDQLFDLANGCRDGGYHGRTLAAMYDAENDRKD